MNHYYLQKIDNYCTCFLGTTQTLKNTLWTVPSMVNTPNFSSPSESLLDYISNNPPKFMTSQIKAVNRDHMKAFEDIRINDFAKIEEEKSPKLPEDLSKNADNGKREGIFNLKLKSKGTGGNTTLQFGNPTKSFSTR